MRGVYRESMLGLVLVAAAVGAADPPVRLPEPPVVPQPMPPTPRPGGAVLLSRDQLYVIDSDVPFLAFASPKGLVKVTREPGPLKVRGKFAGGTGAFETRTFAGKYLATLEPVASGRVELVVVPEGAKAEADALVRLIDVDAGDAPQPTPDPKVDPTPKPPEPKPDAPIPAPGLRVLVVYESADAAKLTAGQQAAIYGLATRTLLNDKCAVGPDGKTREWRIFDKDVDAAADSKLWADAMKRPRKSLPWLVISNGTTGFEGPLESAEQVAELVKKYGG